MADFELLIGQLLGILLVVPSIILYILQCFVIIQNWRKCFNTIFYRLFLLSALNNILFNFFGSSMFGLRLNQIPELGAFFLACPTYLSGLFFGLNYYNLHAENLLTFFMLLQRLITILWPFRSDKIWHFLFPISAILSFCLPILTILHLFTIEVKYYPQPNGTALLNYNHANNVPSNSKIAFIGSTISMAVNCGINLAIFMAYKARPMQQSSNGTNVRIELRLLVYSVAIFFAQTLICAYWILIYAFTGTSLQYHIISQFIWINDIRTIVFPSWFLLYASIDVRRKINEILARIACCCRFLKPESVIITLPASLNVQSNNTVARQQQQQLQQQQQTHGEDRLFIITQRSTPIPIQIG